MKKMFVYAAVLAVAGSAQAATIAWSPAEWLQGGDGSLDVASTGTVFSALNPGRNAVDTTVAGVNFTTNSTVISMGGTIYDGLVKDTSTPTPDANYLNLLSPVRYNVTQIDLSGLTIGTTYGVQIFSSDSRNNGNKLGDYLTLDGGAVTLQLNDGVSAITLGQTSIGFFIADATTQSIAVQGYDVSGSTSTGNGLINAVQVVAIPEPATLGMVALMGGALIFTRRRFML